MTWQGIDLKPYLAEVSKKHGVTIVYAAVMGSRSAGISNDTSDYDIHFIYHRPASIYLGLDKRIDTLYHNPAPNINMTGTDIRKALHLVSKSNKSMVELFTADTYIDLENGFYDRVTEVLDRYIQIKPLAYSYQRTAFNILSNASRTLDPRKVIKSIAASAYVACRYKYLVQHKKYPPSSDANSILKEIDLPDQVRKAYEDAFEAKCSNLGSLDTDTITICAQSVAEIQGETVGVESQVVPSKDVLNSIITDTIFKDNSEKIYVSEDGSINWFMLRNSLGEFQIEERAIM